jgi:hypothetical protein
MATIVSTDLVNTVAAMGLASVREQIQLVKRTNREYERELLSATPNSTVNIIVPAAVTAVAVTPSHVRPGASAVTPTKVPVQLTEWYRTPFAFDDKQAKQVNNGIIPMQIEEAARGLVNAIEVDVWAKSYPKFYGFAGTAGSTPFAADVADYLLADKLANDQIMPGDRRALLMDTAANANWKGLRRNYDTNFEDVGVEPAWTQHVPRHVAGTASGATTDTTGYAVGLKTITLASAGTGSILVGDIITFAGDEQTYTVTAGDASVAGGGTVSFEPGLKVAITTAATAITLKASHRVNLLLHPNAIAFAMAPMSAGMQVPGGSIEATVTDPVSGLGLRLTVTREYYQTEWAFDALWGSAVPRPEFGVRIAGK